MSDQRPTSARIMVVDDTPQNLTLLQDMLRKHGYQVFVLPDGDMALKAAARNPPDLFLLDIRMPGLDGYAVCARLKEDRSTAEIPIIFLSALNETEDKVRAFRAGGVDYITKPFQSEEVEARVSTHLKLRELQRELNERNLNLESLVSRRTRELEEAYERLSRLDRIKSDFLTIISHEMRTPLNGLLGVGELAFDLAQESSELSELWDLYQGTRHRMECLLDDAGTLNTLESSSERQELTSVPIIEILREAARETAGMTFPEDLPAHLATVCVLGEPTLLRRALETLLRLAACFTLASNPLNWSGALEHRRVLLDFELDSLSISEEQAADFFAIASPARSCSLAEPLGLAPVVAHRIVTLFGGDVRLLKRDASRDVLRIELALSE
jgi:two-component system, sensor histidine kinase and response regulator